jgi:hypothetical protein
MLHWLILSKQTKTNLLFIAIKKTSHTLEIVPIHPYLTVCDRKNREKTMKQKLKYLLIIGTTLSIANGAANTDLENADPDGLANLSIRIKCKTTLEEMPVCLLKLKRDALAYMKRQEELIATLEDQKSGFKETIGAIPKAMSQNLMLNSGLASVEIQLQNAQAAYTLCSSYIKDIESGRVESDPNKINKIQQFVQHGLPKFKTTNAPSKLRRTSAPRIEALKRFISQNHFLKPNTTKEERYKQAYENLIASQALLNQYLKPNAKIEERYKQAYENHKAIQDLQKLSGETSTTPLTEEQKDLAKIILEARRKEQAQQNCLGKVTALSHDKTDGNSPVTMTPSITPPHLWQKEAQQVGGISHRLQVILI